MRHLLDWKKHYKLENNLLTLDFCVLTIAIAEELSSRLLIFALRGAVRTSRLEARLIY